MQEYMVVTNESLTDFVQLVADKRRHGWKLQGGVSVAICKADKHSEVITKYAQAMVKDGE